MALSKTSIDNIATVFTTARQEWGSVETYPDEKPQSLKEAYDIQDAALSRFPEDVIGWKVGGIGGQWRDSLGVTRLVGPVFAPFYHVSEGSVTSMPVFENGFAAIEGEVTAVIGADAPINKMDYSTEDALALIQSMHISVEIASSPFSEINDHGPLVTISDFGNNCGLIMGDEIPHWQKLDYASWVFKTVINDDVIGVASANASPGGPLESVRYLLENTARRGCPLTAGMKVLTGAVTGVHQAYAGDTSSVFLNNAHEIQLNLSRPTKKRS